MDSADPIAVKKKRKSLFDVPPEAMHSADAMQQSLDVLLKYSLQNLQHSEVAVKDPVFEQRLKLALEKNFNYIRRKDAMGAVSSSICPAPSIQSAAVKNSHRPVVRSGVGTVQESVRSRSGVNTSIYIAGLPKDMTESELEILFSVHGRLRKIKMYTNPDGTKKGDALVTFNKPESVLVACHQYNGRDIGDGHVLRVTRAEFGASSVDGGSVGPEQRGEADNDDEQAEAFIPFHQGGNLTSISETVRSTGRVEGEEAMEIQQALPPEVQGDIYPVALLRNVYDHQDLSLDAEFFIDLEADLLEECCKMGRVKVLMTPEHATLSGCVTVTFEDEEGANSCYAKLNNRWFDGRQITVQVLLPLGIASATPAETEKPLGSQDVANSVVATHQQVVMEAAEDQVTVDEAVQGVEDFLNSLL